jgi:hypothetical protein
MDCPCNASQRLKNYNVMCGHNTLNYGLAGKLRGLHNAVFVCLFYFPVHLMGWSTWTGFETNLFLVQPSDNITWPVNQPTNYSIPGPSGSQQIIYPDNGSLANYGAPDRFTYYIGVTAVQMRTNSWASSADSGVEFQTNYPVGFVDQNGNVEGYNEYLINGFNRAPDELLTNFVLFSGITVDSYVVFDLAFTRSLIWGNCGYNEGVLGSNCVNEDLYFRAATNQLYQHVYNFPSCSTTNGVTFITYVYDGSQGGSPFTNYGFVPATCVADLAFQTNSTCGWEQCFYPSTNNWYAYLPQNFLTMQFVVQYPLPALKNYFFTGLEFKQVFTWNTNYWYFDGISSNIGFSFAGYSTNYIQPDIGDVMPQGLMSWVTNGQTWGMYQNEPFIFSCDESGWVDVTGNTNGE